MFSYFSSIKCQFNSVTLYCHVFSVTRLKKEKDCCVFWNQVEFLLVNTFIYTSETNSSRGIAVQGFFFFFLPPVYDIFYFLLTEENVRFPFMESVLSFQYYVHTTLLFLRCNFLLFFDFVRLQHPLWQSSNLLFN